MFFSKYVIRESRAICTYELRHNLDLSLLKKWPVFLQNASGNPSFVSVDKPLLIASYQVAFKVKKPKKHHLIAEELIKPSVIEMVTTILRNETRK